ncbi:MAG: vWA domain-containing protein [Deltaproteobacteria bacterium]|nr:vWA domain-containing protein [Deltaproteobacteria bacterium]
MAAKKKTKKKSAPKKKKTKKTTTTTASAPLINHVAFVVDRSGSMAPIRDDVRSIFNDQVAALKELSQQSNQTTFVSFFTFHSEVDEARLLAVPAGNARRLRGWACKGTTALHDAVGQAIHELRAVDGARSRNTSFLVIVLTDGHENASTTYKEKLAGMLATAQNTGRWTFAFLVPPAGIPAARRLGVPGGNTLGWLPTVKGLGLMQRALAAGLKRFYKTRAGARAEGQGHSVAFFGFTRRT